MKRRELLKFLAAATAGILMTASLAFTDTPKSTSLAGTRPNLILIIADDVSFSDLGCYRNRDVRTPALDAMAAKGQRWDNAYLTASVCSPSRASMITSRYPHNTGAPELHRFMTGEQPLFPKSLRDAGYWCVQAGKWHLGNHPKKAFDKVLENKGAGPGGEGQWVDLLRSRPKDKPFFMWFASFDAHRDWQPDPDATPHDPSKIALPKPLVDTNATRGDLAAYYDEIQRLDRYVGKVIEELKRQKILDNTLILFVSDNGRPFPRAKRWLVEDGSRTPFIVHWPKGLSGSGTVSKELVSVIDIAPTFLELAGAEKPKGSQGRSFVPQLLDHKAKICDYVFAERNWQVEYCHERLVRWGDWAYYRNAAPKLSHFGAVSATFYHYPGYDNLLSLKTEGKNLTPAQADVFMQPRPKEQLFDIVKDPDQIKDLAADPEAAKVLLHLRDVMDRWQAETGDTVPSLKNRTPDRHDRITGKRLHEGSHPRKGEYPGDKAGARTILLPGPR